MRKNEEKEEKEEKALKCAYVFRLPNVTWCLSRGLDLVYSDD